MKDLLIYESGDGGELLLKNGDLQTTGLLTNQVYLCLFGGNVESSTKGSELENEVRFDYWANSLIFSDKRSNQFNSETERTLNNVSLNTFGRLSVIDSAKRDLSILKNFAAFEVDAVILNESQIMIEVKLNELGNEEEKVMQMIWDILKNTIIENRII